MECKLLMRSLSRSVNAGDSGSARDVLINISAILDNLLSSHAIDVAISNIFVSSDKLNHISILDFIQNVFIDQKFSESVCEAFKIIEKLLDAKHRSKLELYINDIVSLCLKVLKSACISRIKEASLSTLIAVVSGPWPDVVRDIIDLLMIHISRIKSEKPTVMAKEFELIGLICHNHPEQVVDISEDIGKSILQAIEECVEGKAKVSFPLLEGCFKGISHYLFNFPQQYELIYKGVKLFSDSKEQKRRGYARAAISIIIHHGSYFMEWLKNDRKYWHPLLLKWVNQPNRDDKKVGCQAILKYYEHVGNSLSTSQDEDSSSCLQFFMSYFKTVLCDRSANFDVSYSVSSYEMNLALKGFATFLTCCKAHINDDEFKEIAETITQRALLIYKEDRNEMSALSETADEESTERIEELCNHIEALAVMKYNIDTNLEMLIFTLISGFPKCLHHRHYIIKNAINKALPLTNIQIIVPYLLNESCKHFISSSLYWNIESLFSKNTLLTYEVFMPFWKIVFEVSENNYEISRQAFDELLRNILKLFPTFNLSIKNINNIKDIKNADDVDEFSNLEQFEMPENPTEYKFFTNACDLLSSVLSLKRTREWLVKWIEPLLSLIFEGRQKHFHALGYLKILESVLKCVKNLEKDRAISTIISQELTNIGKIIVELLNDISITNSDKIFELRSALVLLQTPPQLLNDELLQNATYAFKLVFLLGRTNLNLAFEALSILEDWNNHLSKDLLMSTYCEMLPIFNEYLCSTGILESNESKNKEKYINPHFNAAKETINKESISQLSVFQHQIMMFLGKIDSLPIQSFLNSLRKEIGNLDEEVKDLKNTEEKIKISLPCLQQHNLSIYMDRLIPRIKFLALHSTNRDTRITACQTIHSIILVTYGIGVSLPNSQKASLKHIQVDLFTTLLYLASDSDESISKMFTPLLKQTCHWMSVTNENMPSECNNFISVLFKGSTHPSNNLIQDVSCEAIKEFITWYINKSSHHSLKSLSPCISYILRTLCQMMLHPDHNQKCGAYLIIIRIVSKLYLIDSAIDKYFPELLYSVVKSIQLDKKKIKMDLETIHQKDNSAMKILDKLLYIIELKISIFLKTSSTRRRPPGFGNATIEDILLWLLSQLKSDCRPLANRCFMAFWNICNRLRKENDKFLEIFLSKLIKADGMNAIVSKYFENDPISFDENEMYFEKFYETIHSFYISFDIYGIIVKNGIFSMSVLSSEFRIKMIILQFESFLRFLSEHNLVAVFENLVKNYRKCDKSYKSMRILKHSFENIIFKTVWKFMDLLFCLKPKNELYNDSLGNSISLALISIIFEKHKFEIFMRNLKKQDIKPFFINLRNKTSQIWLIFMNMVCEKIIKFFQCLNTEMCSNPEITFEYLNVLTEIINLFDSQSVTQKIRKIDVSKLFDLLFDRNDGILLAKPSIEITLVAKSISNLLKFIFKLNTVDLKTIVEVLIDSRIISNSDTEVSSQRINISYGEFCFQNFKNEIIDFIVENSNKFFEIYIEKITYDQRLLFIQSLDQILQCSIDKNIVDIQFYNNVFSLLNKIWPLLIEWNVEFPTLLHTYSLLAMASPNPVKIFGSGENSLNSWLLSNLKDSSLSLKYKTKMVMLLPTFLRPELAETWYTQSTREALDVFHNHFPQTCYELKPHSKNRADYLSAIKTLLESLANSGSFLILECLIKSTAGDRNHLCEEQISHKLKSFFQRLNSEEQCYILNEVQKMLNSCSDANLLFNITNRFMIPLLLNANLDILENFFAGCISSLINSISKSFSENMSQYSFERLFVEWICALKMLETMFTKVPFEVLNSPDSQICCSLNIEQQGKFVKDVFEKTYNLHKTRKPSSFLQDSTREFLRLSHCAAYKCLYAVTIAKPQENMKLFEFLINPKGSNWESLIDPNKKYEFPMITDKIEKNKSHLIPTKRNNPNISHITSSTLLLQNTLNSLMTENVSCTLNKSHVKNRNLYLKHTLTENILSFDMNNAIIRNSPDFSTINKPDSDIVNYSMDLNDDDLNNHEVMATVCQIVKDLDRMSMSENSFVEASSAGNYSAKWVQNIVDVIGDKSRNRNIRLFLIQVIDNLRDIFKKYSKMMFGSVLSVIVDRCTSFSKKINHLDICLISMLISWNDFELPQGPTEINDISTIYCFIIEEINPSTQNSDVFRRCVELLKDIISIWGHIITLPYDSILSKLKTESESQKYSLQIIASILVNKKAVWNTPDDFQAFTKNILDCLKLTDRTLYKLSAEIIGLTLDVLSNGNPDILKFCQSDFDLIKNYSEMSFDFISKINKLFIKLFETQYEKFIECLYSVHKHFPFCNGSLLSKVLLLLLKLPSEQKKMCLKILLDSMNVLDQETLYKELKALDFDNFLSNYDIRMMTLHVLNKAFNFISVKEAVSLMKDVQIVCDLSTDKDNQSRMIVYEILIKIYNEICKEYEDITDFSQIVDNPFENSHISKKRNLDSSPKTQLNLHSNKRYGNFIPQLSRRKIKYVLLRGLDDEDKEIRTILHSYWTERFNSKLFMHERWTSVLQEFLGDNVSNDSRSLCDLIQIVIASCKQVPNFTNTKIFSNPLEECSFIDCDWKDNKQVRKLSVMPTFVETLNSQLLSSTLLLQRKSENTYDEGIFKSLNSLVNSNTKLFVNESVFTQNTLNAILLTDENRLSAQDQINRSSDNFSLAMDTSLLFTLQPQLIHRQTYSPIKPDPKQIRDSIEKDFEIKLRKKFITNKNQQIIKFSGIAARKKNENMRKLYKEKPIEAFKRFRDGDYPDIQINYDDILIPIFQLALRDEVVSKELFITIFQSIKNHLIEYINQDDDNPSTSSNCRMNITDFEIISMHSILTTLKKVTDIGLSSQLASTLLQICRNCLNVSLAIEDFEQIINNVSKVCDMKWLGSLILEEKKMIEESADIGPHQKKPKLEVTELDVDILDEIYRLKNNNQWNLLQILYDKITEINNIGDDLYKNYTEEYFKCFAYLSDWEGFFNKVAYQYKTSDDSTSDSSESSFNYNVLWRRPWTKDFVLPMIFDANIHKLSLMNVIQDFPKLPKNERKLVAESLQEFDNHVDNWIYDAEKANYMKTTLSWKYAIWKSMLNFDVDALEILKNALSWSKNCWIQEYLSRQSETSYTDKNAENFVSYLNIIQMLSEVFNAVNITNNSFNTNQFDVDAICNLFHNVLKTWDNCTPILNDNLVYWNMRLTSRSILVTRIQKILRTKINTDSESETSDFQTIIKNMSLTQKKSELKLINATLEQSNIPLAEVYLNRTKQYNCLDDKDEMLLGFQFTNSLKIKASIEADFKKKVGFYLDSWKWGENIRVNCTANDDPCLYVNFLNNAALVSYEIFSNIDKLRQCNYSAFCESMMQVISNGKLFSESLSFNNLEEMKPFLKNYCLTYLKKSVKISEKYILQESAHTIDQIKKYETNSSTQFSSNIYMTMAKYCRKFKQDSNDIDLICNIIRYILKAMKFGNKDARQMFPVLLIELEKTSNNDIIIETFKTEIIDMPMWLLTPWVSQLLAHLPKLKNIILDTVVSLATSYPECVVHQYRSSRKMWQISNLSNEMVVITKRLDKILLHDDVEILVNAIGGVCDPYILFEMHLTNIIKALHSGDKDQWDSAFKYMFEDLFPDKSMFSGRKIRGTVFDCISGNKSSLQDSWKSCENKEKIQEVIKKLQIFINICHQNKKNTDSKFISIGNYSPYLSTYGDTDVSLVDIFGQNENFSSSIQDHQNHIKISKFDSEVFVIGSQRKPIRINIIGSNGLKYTFMVKRGEDLRQDERIEQFFELMNDSLKPFEMKINTYKVVPLSWDLGLIQWLHNCTTLRDALLFDSERGETLMNVRSKKIKYIERMPGESQAIQYGNLALDVKNCEQFHLQLVESISPYYLRDVLLKLSKTPEHFIYMRKNYVRSLAPMNIAHWVLGIGDRHMSNCLLSMHTGAIIGIDFERAFGISTQMLSIPELIPFRLTPQLVGVLAPHGIKGMLRELMIQSLDCLKEKSELLLATMEVFVHEPSMNWIKNKLNEELTTHENSSAPKKLSEWSPRDKMNQCHKKLLGVIPTQITIEDLRMRIENRQFIEAYCSIIKASVNNIIVGSSNSDTLLNTNKQVDCLIQQATNNSILSVAFHGLETWL